MKGIDISRHNTINSFPALKTQGIEFCVVRAGYGTITDPKFKAHITSAKAAGMLVGVYWFSYALDPVDAKWEAECCIKALAGEKLDLPVFYDFEYDTERYANQHKTQYTPKSRTDIIDAFCTEITRRGYTAGVYTNPDYWLYRLNSDRLAKYPLWIAAYRQADCKASFTTTLSTDLPPAYQNAMIWQFGKCKFPKAVGYVDINYGYGLKSKPRTTTYTPGEKYTIKKGDMYVTGKAVPSRYVGKTYTIQQVKDDRILLAEILSWVAI